MIYFVTAEQNNFSFWTAPDVDAACHQLNNSEAVGHKVLHERISVYELVHALGFDDDIDARAEGYSWLADLYRRNPDTMLYRSEFVGSGAYSINPPDKKDVLVKAFANAKNKSKIFFSKAELLSSCQQGELNAQLDETQLAELMSAVEAPAKH